MFRYVKGGITDGQPSKDDLRRKHLMPKRFTVLEDDIIDIPEADPNSWQAKADQITKAALRQMQTAGLDVEMAISNPDIIGGVFKIRNATCAKVIAQIYAKGGLFDGKPIYEVRALNPTEFEFGLYVRSSQEPASAA